MCSATPAGEILIYGLVNDIRSDSLLSSSLPSCLRCMSWRTLGGGNILRPRLISGLNPASYADPLQIFWCNAQSCSFAKTLTLSLFTSHTSQPHSLNTKKAIMDGANDSEIASAFEALGILETQFADVEVAAREFSLTALSHIPYQTQQHH